MIRQKLKCPRARSLQKHFWISFLSHWSDTYQYCFTSDELHSRAIPVDKIKIHGFIFLKKIWKSITLIAAKWKKVWKDSNDTMFFDPKMLLRFGEYLIEREHESDVLNNGSNRPHMQTKLFMCHSQCAIAVRCAGRRHEINRAKVGFLSKYVIRQRNNIFCLHEKCSILWKTLFKLLSPLP